MNLIGIVADIMFITAIVIKVIRDSKITIDEEKEIINMLKIVLGKYLKISNEIKAIIFQDFIFKIIIRLAEGLLLKVKIKNSEVIEQVLMLLAVLGIALADGKITEEEKEKIIATAKEALMKLIKSEILVNLLTSREFLNFLLLLIQKALEKMQK